MPRPTPPSGGARDDARAVELLADLRAALARRPPGGAGPPSAGVEGLPDRFIRVVVARCRLAPQDRDDCVQEVCLALLVALPGFELDPGRGRFGDWLGALVRHTAADLRRRRGARAVERLDERAADRLPGREEDPAVAWRRREDRDGVAAAPAAARARLPAVGFRVFWEHHVEGRRLPAIAAELGLTLEQARHQGRRARRLFRRLAARLAAPD